MHLALNFPTSSSQDVLYASSARAAIALLATGFVTEISFSESWCQKHDPDDSIVRFLDQQVRCAEIPMLSWKTSGACQAAQTILSALDAHCRQRAMDPPLTQAYKEHAIACGLNLAETLEQYVCGSGNEAAYAYAVIASHGQSQESNPLFIIGPTGSGKSHLLNAIGLQHLRYANQAKVRRIEASAFRYPERLDPSLATLDLLLIDNLQAVIGHPVAQAHIRFVCETLALRRCQVVLSLRTELNEFPELEQGLLNYINSGVAVASRRIFA
ncbi:MAG: DnaA/Hda family protein [Azonexus sp.]|jgi:chromosomal replication initiation ATPase DnaA|nr:DnaA/Hda family protein [Azonexus sp.]